MSGRSQIVFGLVFVALGVGALFGELEAADQNGRDPNMGWIIGAAGFGLPGLLNVGLGVGRGGLSANWDAGLSPVRRLIALLGVGITIVGGFGLAYALYKIQITTGGDCGGRFSPPCPESSTRWFLQMGVALPAMLVGLFMTNFAAPAAD